MINPHRPEDVKRYPRGKVVATLPAGAADAVLGALRAAGVADGRIDLASGEADARRVENETAKGFWGRLTQRLTPGEEFVQRGRYLEAMRAGRSVLRVSSDPEDKRRVARLIAQKGGYYLNYYGAYTVERLVGL